MRSCSSQKPGNENEPWLSAVASATFFGSCHEPPTTQTLADATAAPFSSTTWPAMSAGLSAAHRRCRSAQQAIATRATVFGHESPPLPDARLVTTAPLPSNQDQQKY